MVSSLFLICVLTVPDSADPQADDPRRQEATRLVQAALDAELAGSNSQRAELLRQAEQADADCAPARWHNRQVSINGQWFGLEAVERHAADSPLLARYRALRDLTVQPGQHLQLARWCAENGLRRQGRLHLVLSGAAGRASAADRALTDKLGFTTKDGLDDLLVEPEEWSRRARQWDESRQAWQEWHPKIAELAERLTSRKRQSREQALAELEAIHDPNAVAALEAVLAPASPDHGVVLVRTLQGIAEHEATMALARQAVFSPHDETRQAAAEALSRRKIHDYAPWLLSQLVSPVKSQFWVESLPGGSFRYAHDFVQQGAHTDYAARVQTNAVAQPRQVTIRKFGSSNPKDWRKVADSASHGTPPELIQALAMKQMMDRQREVARHNLQASQVNARVASALRAATGQQLPDDPVQWWQWWWDYNELQAPDGRQLVSSYYQTNYPVYDPEQPPQVRYIPSCFPAGTSVRTSIGSVAIETIRPGDFVLAQDPETGELAYQIVLGTTTRPATPLVEFQCGSHTFAATKGHPLWVVGAGWRMAKFVQPGDRLHTLDGALTVEAVGERQPEPAYNLIVDNFNSYFVSDADVLVHDNTLRKPTLAKVPGRK